MQLRQEKFLSTVGVDYKSEEWARALRVPVTAKEQSLRFDRLRTPIKQRVRMHAHVDVFRVTYSCSTLGNLDFGLRKKRRVRVGSRALGFEGELFGLFEC